MDFKLSAEHVEKTHVKVHKYIPLREQEWTIVKRYKNRFSEVNVGTQVNRYNKAPLNIESNRKINNNHVLGNGNTTEFITDNK